MKRAGWLLAAVGMIVVLWVLAVPPSGGPDEPSHVVRGAALVRGELNGESLGGSLESFDLPARIAFPDPGCFAFQAETPATCATVLELPTGSAPLATSATHYPVWGHLPAGLGSFLPGQLTGPGTRLFDAVIPAALLGLVLFAAARRGWPLAGAVLLATTVPVWFIIAVVNPSGYVITGALALWVVLSASSWRRSLLAVGARPALLDTVLIAAGWGAMVLPRRDGLFYASLLLALAIIVFEIPSRDLLRLPRWALGAVALSTLVALGWAADSSTDSSSLLFLAVLLPPIAVAARRFWTKLVVPIHQIAFAVVVVIVGVAGSFAVMARRASGFDTRVFTSVIGQTGIDLNEAIGVIGWLDTEMPRSMVMLWTVGLGVLVASGIAGGCRRSVIGAAAVLAAALVVSWVLTMNQNDIDGTYWQGRYYLPLLVGIPVVLATASVDRVMAVRLSKAAAAISLIVLNVGLAAGMRRWGVGQSGTLMPWRWDTYDTVVPPFVLLGAHVVTTAGLWRSIERLAGPADAAVIGSEATTIESEVARRLASSRPPGVNLLGYHGAASGLGVAIRELHASLTAAGVDVSTFDVAASESPQIEGPTPSTAGPVRATTIAVVTAPELAAALAAHPELVAVERVIGYWFWELAQVPLTHRSAYSLVDEVWAPTSFVADAYRSSDDAPPVVVQPLHLARPAVSPDRVVATRERIAPNDEFVFLTSLDLFSIVERKNPFDVISAFAQVDASRRTSHLVIKTLNGDRRPAALQRIVDHVAASGVADRVTILDEFVTDDEMATLVAAADCLVSLHRGEGLGLHLADAMWLGTPVIATRWSGNLDFMDDTNSLLIDAVLVPVTHGEGAYPDDMTWAQPDVAAAAAAMQRLVDDQALGSRIARRARGSMVVLPDSARCGVAYAASLGLPLGDAAEPTPDFNVLLHELRTRALADMPAGAARFLSVGCAGAWYFDWIAEAYGPVAEHVGIEYFSPEPEGLPDWVTWITDTAANMSSIDDSSADLLFSGQNIEHLWPGDVVGFLAESNRVLRDGGTIVVDSPNRPITRKLSWSHPEHTIEFTPDEIEELFELAGFRVSRRVGLWDCGTADRLEATSMSEMLARAEPLGPDRIDDAFVWWFEATRVEDCDVERLSARVETIFAEAWTERMQRRVVDGRAVAIDAAEHPTTIGLPAGDAGVLVQGPNAPLSAGAYSVSFDVVVDGSVGERVGTCAVRAGDRCLGSVELVADGARRHHRIEIDFEVSEMTFGVHGRVDATGSGRLGAAPLFEFSPGRPVGH